jgi:hypothetical protein
MAVRELPGGWSAVLDRVADYAGDLILAAALESHGEGTHATAVSIRGGVDGLTAFDQMYLGPRPTDQLHIFRQPVKRETVLRVLRDGVITPGSVQLPIAPLTRPCTPRWVTQGMEFGAVAPTPIPRLYADFTWWDQIPAPPLGTYSWEHQPLAKGNGPYYPSLEAAIYELLYGRADLTHYGHNWQHWLYLSLAYDTAYLGDVGYVPDAGLVVDVREGAPGSLTGHEVHGVWSFNPADSSFHRGSKPLSHAEVITLRSDAPPLHYSVVLVHNGEIIDEVSGTARATQPELAPLPPTAVPEAFESLDLAWRLLFDRRPLLHNPAPTHLANLTQPATTRDAFAMRLSDLAAVLSVCRVDDSDLPPKHSLPTETVNRISEALHRTLTDPNDPDSRAIDDACSTLHLVNQTRAALQHTLKGREQRDLRELLNRLGIDYPPKEWPQAWDLVCHRMVEALSELRRVIRTKFPE